MTIQIIKKLAATLGAVAVFAVGVTGAAHAKDEDVLPIKVAWQGSEQAAFFLAMHRDMFTEAGLAPDYIKFTAGVPMISALISDSVDVAVMGTTPTMVAITQNSPVKIINISNDTADSEALIAKPEYSSLEDLRGKKIGVTKGSSAHHALLNAIKQGEYKEDDFNILDMDVKAMMPSWVNNEVDAIWVWQPFAAQLVENGGERIMTDRDVGSSGALVWLARNKFIENESETLNRFVGVLGKASKLMMTDDDARADAINGMADAMNLSYEQAEDVFETSVYFTIEQQMDPSSSMALVDEDGGTKGTFNDAVIEYSEVLETYGVLDEAPEDISEFIDISASQAYLDSTKKE